MVSVTQLEYILAVEKHKHFGKAAEACFVTQPTLSMQLQKLENEMGIVLFDRSKKPIQATPQGRKIIDQAMRVVKELRTFQSLADFDQEEGDLVLGIIPTLAPYIAPLFLEKFSKNYPSINLKVRELTTSEIIRSISEESLDVGLLVTPLYHEELVEKKLFYEEFFIYCHPESPMATKKNIKQSDLDVEGLWLLQEGHCFREQVLNVCNRKSDQSFFKNINYESGSFETIKNMIDINGGYTFLPRLASRFLLGSQYQKKIKVFSKPIPVREVSLVYSKSHFKMKMMSNLEACILDSLPKNMDMDLEKRMSIIDI